MENLTTQLAKAVLFRGFDQGQLQAIFRISKMEQLKQDAVIFNEGDPGDELYLIVKGKVRVSRQFALGGDETLDVLEEGQVFGEMAVIGDDVVRSATASAAEETILLVLKRGPFQQLLHKDRDLAYIVLWNLLRQVSGRLRATNEKVMMFLTAAGLY
ncbi:MAG: cyclic nucleotide-binding domain-containing protein [candidate division NC10 bacterium]|nr:cyclic nucleotide-binding domain-containing protein [candidate division NC10 bacterium]